MTISGLLTSFGKNAREALNSKEPTKIGVAKYPKTSLYGLTLTKPLRQFHDWQRNIHQLIATTLVLAIEPKKNKRYKFRTIRRKSSIVGATTGICVASDFTTRQ